MMAMVPPSTGQSNKLDVQETTAWYERRLRDGSNLKYRLTILQQPERARACGQGAKSHADRRPVDPPPVVELRLFHGEDQKDVTFSFNSNFFLFATLEPARPIANGRVVPTPAQAPVLTGVPVSGMAYLDRSAPAGYFIFPDLSVRHEGKYRLHFALFEECKEEGDRDAMSNGEVISFRVEVKSKPFTVFSAKKFPGLAESTSLSRIVAEQGCRVRIRRDVRMRRRAEKPSGGRDEEMMEETELRRREHVSQPQQPQQPVEKRERSDSNNAPAAAAPEYNRPSYERPSYSQPQPPSSAAPSNSHLSFSANQTSQSHIAPPPPAGAPQSWQSQQYERPQATQPSQPTSSTEYRRESGEYFKRRDSETYSQPPQPTPAQQPPQQAPYYSQSTPQSYSAPSPYAPPPSQSRSHRNSRDDLPPLKLAALEPRLGNGMNSPSSGTPNSEFIAQRSSSQSLPSPSTYGPPTSTPRSSTSAPSSGPSSYSGPPSYYPQHQQQSSSDWSYSASQKIVPAPEPAPRHAGAKRSWDRVFNDSHVRDRLQNGMRPSQNPTHYGIDADDDDDDEIDYTLMRMSYRRADGVQIVRALPDESD